MEPVTIQYNSCRLDGVKTSRKKSIPAWRVQYSACLKRPLCAYRIWYSLYNNLTSKARFSLEHCDAVVCAPNFRGRGFESSVRMPFNKFGPLRNVFLLWKLLSAWGATWLSNSTAQSSCIVAALYKWPLSNLNDWKGFLERIIKEN